jgi:hypothetical protein
MKQNSFIYVTFQREGYHCFPEAATDPKYCSGGFYDVSHLANKHMHYFYFKVWVEVNHNNRDIEFIQFRRWLESLYANNTLELNNSSCEMICENLYKEISKVYPNSEVRIDVSEDNINGAYIEFKQ